MNPSYKIRLENAAKDIDKSSKMVIPRQCFITSDTAKLILRVFADASVKVMLLIFTKMSKL